MLSAIRSAVARIDSGIPVFHERTFAQQVENMLEDEKFLGRLLMLFALVAVTLAAAGVFGLISYSTARATRAFGIRIALGATREHVLWLVLRRGLMLVAIGLIIGIGAALWLTRIIANQLFGVSPTDPLTFVAVALAMTVVALAACFIPARRATRVDPMIALRSEVVSSSGATNETSQAPRSISIRDAVNSQVRTCASAKGVTGERMDAQEHDERDDENRERDEQQTLPDVSQHASRHDPSLVSLKRQKAPEPRPGALCSALVQHSSG